MGKSLKKQVRPNKHRWGTIHNSCIQIIQKKEDPIPGRPGEYYLPHCVARISAGLKGVPKSITSEIAFKASCPRIFIGLTFEAEVYEKFLAPAMEFDKCPSSLGYKYCFKSGDFPDEIRRRTIQVKQMKDDPENAFPDTWAAIQAKLYPLEAIGGMTGPDTATFYEQHVGNGGDAGWVKLDKHYTVWRRPRLLICNLRSPQYRQACAIHMCREWGMDIGDVRAEDEEAALWFEEELLRPNEVIVRRGCYQILFYSVLVTFILFCSILLYYQRLVGVVFILYCPLMLFKDHPVSMKGWMTALNFGDADGVLDDLRRLAVTPPSVLAVQHQDTRFLYQMGFTKLDDHHFHTSDIIFVTNLFLELSFSWLKSLLRVNENHDTTGIPFTSFLPSPLPHLFPSSFLPCHIPDDTMRVLFMLMADGRAARRKFSKIDGSHRHGEELLLCIYCIP
jgi:hypothetical protein